ncbi:MAG: 4-(cytidine 5'-diphospho)-2-C-methyl-D-erythritol kinase [Sphingomonadaceae bacterium]|nr:4-(cytidine 5'-diphospho)-2-C-methyl-D-erythritol kinase [Sphingomonadaceae bacterium]
MERETAYAKINLALHVRRRRADGYHDIETVFAFCEDGDVIEAEASDTLSLTIEGPFGRGLETEDNLILRAARAVGATAALRLSKNLPVASGVGGGSADAAAALRLLGTADPAIAAQLGSDVPACLGSTTARGEGRGETLLPVEPVTGTPILLVNPRIPLSTARVFAAWDGIDRGRLGDWRAGRNDLEAPARALVPEIAAILDWLNAQPGVTLARMSGSGATCFALFESEAQRDRAVAAVPAEWWHMSSRLR